MANQIVTPTRIGQPRLVTLAELRKRLLPFCMGWTWAEDAIADLWKLGAPIPGAPGAEERRILLPGQFAKWWQEVSERQGHVSDSAVVYRNMESLFRASAGETGRTTRNGGG